MENAQGRAVQALNALAYDLDEVYHQAARKLGVTDSAMYVLYRLYELGDGCRLQDICREAGISKQTINSALRKLEQEGTLYLTPEGGKAKRVRLTEAGKVRVSQTAARLYSAECAALEGWTKEEIETHLHLMTKYIRSLSAQINSMEGNTL